MTLKPDSPEIWVLRPWTETKHRILRLYFRAWFSKLGSAFPLRYVDGFAGRGNYEGDAPEDPKKGSPIQALNLACKWLHLIKKGITFDFIEKDPNNFNCLQKEVITRDVSPVGERMRITMYNAEFADMVTEEILPHLRHTTPTLFFIDPFGYAGIPFGLFEQIMKIPRQEIILTFMSEELNRFCESEMQQGTIQEFFGRPIPQEYLQCSGDTDRRIVLAKYFRDLLKQESGIRYVLPVMIPEPASSRPRYFLFFCSNSFDGFKIMKDTCYKTLKDTIFRFITDTGICTHSPQQTFEDIMNPPISRLQDHLMHSYNGRTVPYKTIYEEQYEFDYFVQTHFREAIRGLEHTDRITVSQKGARGGLLDTTLIEFTPPPHKQSRLF